MFYYLGTPVPFADNSGDQGAAYGGGQGVLQIVAARCLFVGAPLAGLCTVLLACP